MIIGTCGRRMRVGVGGGYWGKGVGVVAGKGVG